MQAGYRRDPNESAKALKAKLKGKRRDSVLYGAVIKQQNALGAIGNTPPTNPTNSTPPVAREVEDPRRAFSSLPTGMPSIGKTQPSNEKMIAYEQQYKEKRPYQFSSGPKGSIDEKMLQERRDRLKKNDDTVVKIPTLTKQQELEAALLQKKSELTPTDSRKPSVGINANPQSSTMASQSDIADIASLTPSSAPVVLPPKPANDQSVQGLAEQLLTRVNAIRTQGQMDHTKQIVISAFDYNGSAMPNTRFTVKRKDNGGGYRFDITNATKGSRTSGNLMQTDQGINLPDSIAAAINKVSNGSYNSKAGTGEINGLGLNADSLKARELVHPLRAAELRSDPSAISSTRITWMNNRASGRKLPKGMIYVMGPSLLKGDLRVYAKSGRPIMSISKISPAFQRIVRDVIDRNTFDPQDFSAIEPSESADVNQFITISKPVSPSGVDRLANADMVWKLKKRYEVLVGQLSAGNDGLIVRREMEDILRSLMRVYAINPVKAKGLIKALNEYST